VIDDGHHARPLRVPAVVASRTITPAHAAMPSPAITRVALCDITNPNQCADILYTAKMVVDPATGLATQTRRGVGVFQQ